MKNRSKTEIISNMLEIAVGGSSRTRIMYRSFLSNLQLRQYMALLLETGLIDFDVEKGICKTTEKGLRFLEISRELDKMCRPITRVTIEYQIMGIVKEQKEEGAREAMENIRNTQSPNQ